MTFYARRSRPRFDAGAAVTHLGRADRTMGRLIERVGPYELKLQATRDTFAALAEAIVHQQLTGKAAATILGRFVSLYSTPFPTAEAVLRTPDEKLRAAGLSGAKTRAVKDLAERVSRGEIPSVPALRRMQDEHVIERLTQVRGIGQWTVEMLLIFRLGRPDVLPVGDYGVRKGFSIAYKRAELPLPRELAEHGQRWAPYRSVAAWYLWRAVDLAGPVKPKAP
jgi:3-methyladenine DNA glycosylase/8-oxoguanine DNA glycosylase